MLEWRYMQLVQHAKACYWQGKGHHMAGRQTAAFVPVSLLCCSRVAAATFATAAAAVAAALKPKLIAQAAAGGWCRISGVYSACFRLQASTACLRR